MGDGAVSALLELQSVKKTFDSNGNRLTVLDNLNLSIEQGSFVTILGASGCGKSTMLQCIGGFIKPDEGQVLLRGVPVSAPTPSITMVFQTFDQLFPWKTVRQNLT